MRLDRQKTLLLAAALVVILIAIAGGVFTIGVGLYTFQTETINDFTVQPSVLETIAKRVNFQLFTPSYLPNVRIAKDWYITEFQGAAEVSIVYETEPGVDQESAFVRMDQRKAEKGDMEMLRQGTAENEYFIFHEVRIGDTKGFLIRAKYDLPYKKTSYDPRRAARLIVIKNGTYILLWSSDVDAFRIDELINVAESLRPI